MIFVLKKSIRKKTIEKSNYKIEKDFWRGEYFMKIHHCLS